MGNMCGRILNDVQFPSLAQIAVTRPEKAFGGLVLPTILALFAIVFAVSGQPSAAQSPAKTQAVKPAAGPASVAASPAASSEAADADPPIGSIDLTVTVPRRTRCGTTDGRGEIVVCGADHGDDVRVPSTADSDPNSKEGQNTGLPQAPSVSGLPDCRKTKCHGFGRAPPRIYVIDMKSIPEAPKGSDADKVAKGEIPDR